MPEFTVPTPQSSFSNPLPPTPPTPPTPPLPPEPKTNWFKIILLSLLGLAVVLGLVALAFWYGTQKSSTTESTETPTTETEETEELTDATADWESFSSPLLPVTFKYPEGVYPFGADLGPIFFPDSGSSDFHVFIRATKPMTSLPETWDTPISPVEIIVGQPFGDLNEYISSLSADVVEGSFTRETVKADGFDWVVVSFVNGPGPWAGSRTSEALFQTGDYSLTVYNYGWEQNGVSDAIFKQILSTFQFTTPTADETADWEIYTNEELSFRYPSDWSLSGVVITLKSPEIRLVVVSDSGMMNECMQETSLETEDGLTVRRFSRVTTSEMCGTSDSTPREIWVIRSPESYGPGISYEYSSTESSQAEAVFTQILSTFQFLD